MKVHENPTSMIQRINPSQNKLYCPEVLIIRGYDTIVLCLHYLLVDADLQGQRTRLISIHTFLELAHNMVAGPFHCPSYHCLPSKILAVLSVEKLSEHLKSR